MLAAFSHRGSRVDKDIVVLKPQDACRDHIIQYHEVIGGLVGHWGETAALFFNVVSLLGLAVVQIIACASDAYYLYDALNKR